SYIVDGLGGVHGTVSEEGNDDEPPEYDHEAPTAFYEEMDSTLHIHASDNISIRSVELSYKINDGEWQTAEAEITSGDFKDGQYSVMISGNDLEKGELTYHWTIRDYGSNDVTSDDYV